MLVIALTFVQCKKAEEPCGCGEGPWLGAFAKNWEWESSKNTVTNTTQNSQSAGYTVRWVIKSDLESELIITQFKNEVAEEELVGKIITKDQASSSVVIKNNKTNKKRQLTVDRNTSKLRVSEEVNENDNFTGAEEHIYTR